MSETKKITPSTFHKMVILKISDIVKTTSLLTFNGCLTWLLLGLFFTTVAAELPKTSFAIGYYANSGESNYANEQYRKTILSIPNAEALKVTVEGEIEDCCQAPANERVERCCHRSHYKRCCDFIIIRDSENHDHTFNGQIHEEFTVLGHSITVIFKSDNATTAKGVQVNITGRSALDVFNELKTRLSTATDTILKQGTGEAYLKLEQRLKSLETLHEQLENTQNPDEIIESVATMLITLGQTYHEIASKRATIASDNQTQLNFIQEIKATTQRRIDKAAQEKQNYTIMLDKVQNTLAQTMQTSEKQKLQISVNGYTKNIQALQMQEIVWQRFLTIQENLEYLLQQHIQKIEVFLHFLEISGQVYEQAANVALLKETTVIAFDKLVDLTALQNIVMEIQQSEHEIQNFLKNIEQADFQHNDLL